MPDLFRDTPFGQVVRWVTKNHVFQYPEEKSDFQLPSSYYDALTEPTPVDVAEKLESEDSSTTDEEPVNTPPVDGEHQTLEATISNDRHSVNALSQVVSRPDMSRTTTRADLEKAYTAATMQDSIRRQASRPIAPTKTADGTILVDWYTTDDPENPQNWAPFKKTVAVLQIYVYTFVVYMASSIFTPAEPELIEIFGISQTVASLGLGLYVLGYGIGPLFFSPLSEIPVIGRNPPYMISFAIYVVLCIPTALVNNIPGLLILRFLQGFFGSPCLATAGASVGDVTNLIKLPYYLFGWALFALAGPAVGPLISGFSVPAENWRWAMWEILWIAGPTFLSMFFLLPETSTPNILLRRAQRIRALTGNPAYMSQSEITQKSMSFSTVAYEAFVIPWKINLLDPAVLFTSIYTALVYAIFYSFFEVFPLVYMDDYGMNIGQMGLIFISVVVGVFIAMIGYFAWVYYVFEPEVRAHGLGAPERRLTPALFACFLPPIGLFIFGWTARTSVHWIVPTIGVAMVSGAMVALIQSILVYVALAYPQYAASLFAGNDFARSALAFAAILFSEPLFHNLGVARGVTLLAGLTIGCIVGVYILYFYGAKLRARSSFAV